jgi:hypothetical protein
MILISVEPTATIVEIRPLFVSKANFSVGRDISDV